jgi:hypothetical protein
LRKKLLILNLALGVLLIAGLLEFRHQVIAAWERYSILSETGGPVSPTAFPAPNELAGVRPADHLPIVERLLFSPDRNPIVEVEAPAPAEAVKRPPLPVLVGVMDFGHGPIALMAPDGGTRPKPVALGERVGEYIFRAAGLEKITLEWQGQNIEVAQSELVARATEQPRTNAIRESRGGPRPTGAVPPKAGANTTEKRESSSLGGKYNIGREIRPGVYAADPKDTAADGTVYQGHIKRTRRTPFGTTAWWEKQGTTGESK